MSKTHYVYKVTNLETGEYYYGKRSCNCDWREDSYMGSGVLLKNKMEAHPDQPWVKEVLLILDSEEEAYLHEQLAIGDRWRDDPLCLNLTAGGEGGCSESTTLLWEDPEYRRRQSAAQSRHYEDPTARLKASEAQKRRCEDPAERERMRQQAIKQWEDPAARERVRQQAIKQWEDPAARERQSGVMKRRFEDPAEREKISEAQKRRYEDPAARERLSKAKRRSTIPLLLDGEEIESTREQLKAYLILGAEFKTTKVQLHHLGLEVRVSVVPKTARNILLTQKGWHWGNRTKYPRVTLKSLVQAGLIET